MQGALLRKDIREQTVLGWWVVTGRYRLYSLAMWPKPGGHVAVKHWDGLSGGACRAGLWTSVYSHPSQNLYHEFIFGAALSRTLVQSEFISSFWSSAHFRSGIPAWLFNKSLFDLRQHLEEGRLGVQPELWLISTPPLPQLLGLGAHPKLSWALFPPL